ncbi:MAG: hypothetical protein HRF48_14575 [Chloroflexota bacterium]|jgi:hypothetical protein
MSNPPTRNRRELETNDPAATQRAAIRRVRPWTRRTREGLRRSARNAWKNGRYSAEAMRQAAANHARAKVLRALLDAWTLQLYGLGLVHRRDLPHVARHKLAATIADRLERWGRRLARLGLDELDRKPGRAAADLGVSCRGHRKA